MSYIKTKAVKRGLSRLFAESHRLGNTFYILETIRCKLEDRDLQPFDSTDILLELGSLQQAMKNINKEMLSIHDILKSS